MYKQVIKSSSNKNSIINSSISLDELVNEETAIGDFVYNEVDMIENHLTEIEKKKYILDLKYLLKQNYSEVYELKINGFSNQNIAVLLDLRYKDVDNYLRSIKNTLKKKTDIEYLN